MIRTAMISLSAAVSLFLGTARADVFILRNDAQIRGKLLNDKESPRKTYVVETETGEVTLEKSQVVKVVRESPALEEYQRIQANFADTIEGQLEAAAWCKKHKLSAQRQTHLERVIELDPEHLEARRALGYIRAGGKWTTREDDMESKGYVRHGGKWLLPQEMQILKEREAIEAAIIEWRKKVRAWRRQLDHVERAQGARESFLAIRDPVSLGPLLELMKEEKDPATRSLYIEVLALLDNGAATSVLVDYSLHDNDPEIRDSCLDHVERRPHPDVVAAYVTALKSNDNNVVNRAARALSRLKDSSSVGPLIDALVTTHKFKISTGDGGTSVSHVGPAGGGPGSGGFTFNQGGGAKVVSQDLQNEAVRDALIQITGQNFHFDESAWGKWHRSQRKDHKFSARRDDGA